MELNIYTDGGARGNPGPAGFGFVIYGSHQKILVKCYQFLGTKTNNEAEYLGLISALNWLRENQNKYQISAVNFNSDSELLIRQITGVYKVKAPHLKDLYLTAYRLFSALPFPIKFHHVFRESNDLADKLANMAMDGHQNSCLVFD